MHGNGKLKCQTFTLIEVLIAVTLLVTILGLLFVSTATVLSSWEQLERHSHGLQETIALDRVLDNLLANMIPFSWPGEDLEDSSIAFFGENDTVIFTYMHTFNKLEDGAIRSCQLLQEDDEFVAYYCERPPFPEDLSSEKLRRSVLARNVESVSFSYVDLDERDIEFVEEWDDRDYLPLATQIEIIWLDGTERRWFRRSAGSSYFERWGKWEQKERI